MYKQIVFFLLLVLCSYHPVNAQETEKLVVIFVKGTLQNLSKKQAISRGAILKSSDKIQFSDMDSRALVISNLRGRYILSPKPLQKNSLIGYVVDLINPLKTKRNISPRGGDGPIDPESYFGADTFYIPGQELTIPLNTDRYPLDMQKSFVYRFTWQGQTILRTIPTVENNKLSIRATDIYKNKNGQSIEPDSLNTIEIYYYDKEAQSSRNICRFKPIFLDETELREAFSLVGKQLKKQKIGVNEKEEFLLGLFGDYYGTSDENLLLQKFRDWKII